jgi:hypothetical protein
MPWVPSALRLFVHPCSTARIHAQRFASGQEPRILGLDGRNEIGETEDSSDVSTLHIVHDYLQRFVASVRCPSGFHFLSPQVAENRRSISAMISSAHLIESATALTVA